MVARPGCRPGVPRGLWGGRSSHSPGQPVCGGVRQFQIADGPFPFGTCGNQITEIPSFSSACRTVRIGMPANVSNESRSSSPVTIASASAPTAQISTWRSSGSRLAGFPLQREPETSTLTSTTSFTRASFGPDSLYFSANLVHGRWFSWQGTNLVQHLFQFLSGIPTTHLFGQQFCHSRAFQQTHLAGLADESFGQIQFNRDAHNAFFSAISISRSPLKAKRDLGQKRIDGGRIRVIHTSYPETARDGRHPPNAGIKFHPQLCATIPKPNLFGHPPPIHACLRAQLALFSRPS